MEYRNLGKSGLKVSALSFGSWITFGKQIEDNTSLDLMACAYDHGVNFLTMQKSIQKANQKSSWAKICKNWPGIEQVIWYPVKSFWRRAQ